MTGAPPNVAFRFAKGRHQFGVRQFIAAFPCGVRRPFLNDHHSRRASKKVSSISVEGKAAMNRRTPNGKSRAESGVRKIVPRSISETYKACPKGARDAANRGSLSLSGVRLRGWQQTPRLSRRTESVLTFLSRRACSNSYRRFTLSELRVTTPTPGSSSCSSPDGF